MDFDKIDYIKILIKSNKMSYKQTKISKQQKLQRNLGLFTFQINSIKQFFVFKQFVKLLVKLIKRI